MNISESKISSYKMLMTNHLNFKSEFEAAFPASKKELGGGLFSQKFHLEVSLMFKEASPEEIESIDNLKSHITSIDLKDFKVVNTRRFLLRDA